MQKLTLENDFLKTFAPFVKVAEEGQALRTSLYEVTEELRGLQKIRRKMFEFEDKTSIDATIKPVNKKYWELKIAEAGYTEKLSLDAFKLRRADGLPTFMIVGVERRERIFGIRVDSQRRRSFTPYTIPDVAQKQFEDVIDIMHKRTRGWWFQFPPSNVSIHAELSGHMPDDVRDLVHKAKKAKIDGLTIFDKFFVIAEAPEWKIDAMPIAKTDPLVVGYHYWTEQFFLITVYDPTDLEKYLAEQYTHLLTGLGNDNP